MKGDIKFRNHSIPHRELKNQSSQKKNNKQLIWGVVLFGYGIYSSFNSITTPEPANYMILGQAAVFIIWGFREMIGWGINNE